MVAINIPNLLKTLDFRSNPNSTYMKLPYKTKERIVNEAIHKGNTDENSIIQAIVERIKNSPKPKSFDHVLLTNPKKYSENDLSIISNRQKVQDTADQMLLDDANEYMVELENELRSGRNSKFIPLNKLENYLDLKSSSLADDDDTMNYARTLLRQIEDKDRFAKEDFEAMIKDFGERETTSLLDDPHAVAEAQQNLDIFEKELDYFNKNYGTETPLDRSNIFKKRLKEGTQKSINDYRLNNKGYYPSNEEQNIIRQNVYKNLTKQATKKKDINEYGITPEKAEINRRNKIFADNREKVNEISDMNIGNDELLDDLTRLYMKDNYKSAEWIDKSLPPKSKAEMDKQYADYRTDVWKHNPDTKKGILKDYKETVKTKKQDLNYIGSKEYGQDRQKFIKRLDDLDRYEQLSKQKELNPFEISDTTYNTQSLNLSKEQNEILNLLENINNQPKINRYLDNMFGNKEKYSTPKTDTSAGQLISKQEKLRSSAKLVDDKDTNKQIRKINQKERLNILQDRISKLKQEKQNEFMLRTYLYSLLSDISL